MPLITVEKAATSGGERVWVLRMRGTPAASGSGYENKLSGEFVRDMHRALDEVEREFAADKSLGGAIVTVGEGKHYSDGLDLEFLMGLGSPDKQTKFLEEVQQLFLRLLLFPMPTIAAINGHAFAGGFLLALAHDYRVGNADKGFACMTEVDLGFPLTGGFNALLKEKLPRRVAARMMVEAVRFNGKEMAAFGVYEQAVGASEVLPASVALAARISPKGASPAMQSIKEDLYLDCAKVLRDPSSAARPKL